MLGALRVTLAVYNPNVLPPFDPAWRPDFSRGNYHSKRRRVTQWMVAHSYWSEE